MYIVSFILPITNTSPFIMHKIRLANFAVHSALLVFVCLECEYVNCHGLEYMAGVILCLLSSKTVVVYLLRERKKEA